MKTSAATLCFVMAATLAALGQQQLKPIIDRSNSCSLPDGFNIVHVDEVDQPMTRSIKIATGEVPVTVQSGARILIAHADGSPFGNIKAETIAPGDWKATSKTLIDGTEDFAVSSSGILLSKLNGKQLHGFDVYGIDRQKKEGGVLGIYLLLRESDHLAITAYLLNEDPPANFKTIEQFGTLRDDFLEAYTACLAKP